MWLNKLYQRLLRRPETGWAVRATATRRQYRRPIVEQLEDRTLLSNFTAANVSDLIADINAANLAGGSNTITLVAGNTFSLTAVDNTTDGATGLPVIAANDNLTIVGNGDTIERGTAPYFRLLEVAAGASLTLRNLTLQNGVAAGSGQPIAAGGAVYNLGTLDLQGVTVQNNTATGLGGWFGLPCLWGTCGAPTGPAAGGGIYSSGTLTLEAGTTVQNNRAIGGNGYNSLPGQDAFGGGVYVASGMATLSSANVSSNSAQGGQGSTGFSRSGGCRGWNCAIRVPGGHGGNAFGGGLYVAAGTVTVTDATLSANTVNGGNGGAKGTGPAAGAGGNGLGGGLYLATGTVTLRNDIVTSNSAQRGTGGLGTPPGSPGLGKGGGLYINPTAAVSLDTFTRDHVTQNTASTSDPDIFGTYTLVP